VQPEGSRRRLRFPPDAPIDVRSDRAREDERRDLPRNDEENPGRRVPDRRGPGAPLSPRVRQVTVLQLPSPLQDRCGCHAPLVRARRAPGASARARHFACPERSASVTDGYLEFYRDRSVMITGGLGFIGSNLARRLVDLGADVLLVDSLIPDYGGNLFNID